MALSLISAVFTAAVAAAACDEQQQPVAPGLRADVRIQLDSILPPIADTYVRLDLPNTPQGSATPLQVSTLNRNRSLFRWDTTAIRLALGGGTLQAARLELTINQTDANWGSTGRTIDLFRLTQAWTEAGATWSCAIDTVPGNGTHDCSGAGVWQMGSATAPPFVATPTASAVITNGQTGTVSFDVSTDVAAILAGTQTHYGWIVKRGAEDSSGAIRFNSRESGTKPRLVLSVQQDTSRPAIPSTFTFPSDTSLAVGSPSNPAVRYYRNVVGIQFDDTTSGQTIRDLMLRYNAVIIGGIAGEEYVVRLPDPGPAFRSLDSLVSKLSHEPGVTYAAGVTFRDVAKPQSRFPNDGIGLDRNAWFTPNPTAAVWPWLQIRAPLAWGCENGEYGSSRPRIGVIDITFDAKRPTTGTHPDLDSSRTSVFNPDTIVPVTVLPSDRAHGTGVAGVLAAVGDNSRGIPGMLWSSSLYLFALGADSGLAPDLSVRYKTILATARVAGVRVIVSSVFFGEGDSLRVGRVRSSLRKYLDAGLGNLLVMPTGNVPTVYDVNVVAALGNANVGLLAAAAQLYTTTNQNNIIFVAGSNSQGQAWDQSTFFRGGTEIVAPATNITTLAERSPDYPTGMQVPSGTSLAAPFVAGVAGMLLSMDSTLSPALVKQYITRGASEPTTISPATGDTVTRQPVTGFPELVFELDAYGSLMLLSRERAGTPICGYPVRVGDNNASVVLEPPGVAFRTLPVTGFSVISAVSVAQGGRLISAQGDDGSSVFSVLIDNTGAEVRRLSGVWRAFLEKDTVDYFTLDTARYEHFTSRRADGTILQNVDPVLPSYPPPGPSGWFTGGVSIALAPSGDFVLVSAAYELNTNLCSAEEHRLRTTLVPTGGGPVQNVEDRLTTTCNGLVDNVGGVVWSHDGRRGLALSTRLDAGQAFGIASVPTGHLTVGLVGGGVATGDASGAFLSSPRFTADDSLFYVGESADPAGAGCQLVTRSASNPGSVLSSATGRTGIDCLFALTAGRPPAIIPNSRTDARAGFSLAAPAQHLLSARRFHQGARRVQAN